MTTLISLELSINFLLTATYSEFGPWGGGGGSQQQQQCARHNHKQTQTHSNLKYPINRTSMFVNSGRDPEVKNVDRCTPAIFSLLFYN